MDGHGKSASVIDPKSRKAVATIPLSGKPETPVPDGKGRMYINIEDKNTIAVVDSKANKVIAEWPMAGCDEPSGLDMDLDTGNLFAACGNKLMAIVDSKTGNLITTIPTGDGSDGLAFDPNYTSSGLFYTYYSFPGGGAAGQERVVRYTRSTGNPNVGRPCPRRAGRFGRAHSFRH